MTIIVLYNFRYKKLSKLCIQLLRYKQPVPYLPVNASMDNTILKKWSVSNAGIYEKVLHIRHQKLSKPCI